MSRSMRIGIDARMIGHSGIGTYLRNFLSEIPHCASEGFEFHLFGDCAKLPEAKIYSKHAFGAPIYSLSEQAGYLRRTPGVQLWHSPHFNAPYWCRSRLVATIHDIIPWIFAGRFFSLAQKYYISALIKRIAGTAERIITVSHHTKNDLMRHFGVPEKKIRVIHEGVGAQFRPINNVDQLARVRAKYNLPETERFFLFVSNLKPHKNLGVLLEAVKKLRFEDKISQKLLVVGRKDREYPSDQQYLAALRTDENVHYLEEAEYADLPALFNLADAFVLPSLYEGFGLTVLEAFACGVPVIASNRSSLPEIAGDAALYFDAESAAELERALLRISGDPALAAELSGKGRERAELFSWNKMARETLTVYEEVLKAS